MTFTLSGTSVLITGGTGSLGNALIQALLLHQTDLRQIIIFSRDELKQFEQKKRFVSYQSLIRWKIGDVRDYDALLEACTGVDYIFHLAALKQVPACEENPEECIKTNVMAMSVLMKVAKQCKVRKVIATSTDKAVDPSSTYGASKLLMERLILSESFSSTTQFAVARFGNFAASRGSVFPLFVKQLQNNEPLTITDLRMTRFCITEVEAARFLLEWIQVMEGGEVFIPKMKSYTMRQIVEALEVGNQYVIVGKRIGEKLHEHLIASQDERWVQDRVTYYLLRQKESEKKTVSNQKKAFVYSSECSEQRYTNADIKVLLSYVRQQIG